MTTSSRRVSVCSSGADVGVAGLAANSADFNEQMKHAAPFVFAFVLAFAFVLLLITFGRS